MEFDNNDNSMKKKKSKRISDNEGQSSRDSIAVKKSFVALNQEDKLWIDNEMFREKIYSKFLNDPLNMEKNIIKQIKRVKSKKPKHIEKA